MAVGVEEATTEVGEIAEIRLVGEGMELVTKGTLVGRPLLSRLVGRDPVVLGFELVTDGTICTVPEGLTLVEMLWVEVLLTLATALGVELRMKLGRRAMIGGEELGLGLRLVQPP